ncbi:MAG: DUF2914 domain-containing protein [Acidobacteriota bacterium]|jgi:cytoskeletal protein RodZ
MSSFGQQLKRQRESRGLDLDDVAEATKIARHHLEALEEGDLERLPGPIFNRGYVRAYAEFVGLDSERAVADYAAEEKSRGPATPSAEEITREIARAVETRSGSPIRGLPFPPWAVAAAGGLLVVAILLGWLWLRSGPSPETSGAADAGAGAGASAEAPREIDAPVRPDAAEEPAGNLSTATSPEKPAASVADGPPAREAAAPVVADTLPAPEAAARQRPAPAESAAPPPAATAMRVSESGVGTGVVDRILVGRTDRFAPGSVAWFWTRVVDGSKGEEVRHVWIHEGQEVATLSFTVGGPHWRVSSRKTLREGSEGRWAAEARDASGRVLAREEFLCEPGGVEDRR